jgi:hypothetical protein
MINEIIGYLIAIAGSSATTLIAVLWLLFKYPEKVEKWLSMLARLAAGVSDRAAKVHMSTDIQSTIDSQRKNLNKHEELLPYGVAIKWSNLSEVQTDLKENKVLIMMRPYSSQSRNLAHIVSVYVPRALLPKARRYVEPRLMTGIDHVISKSILASNTSALEYYSNEVIGNIDEIVKSYVIEMDRVHREGALTRVVLPELRRLNILYPHEPDEDTQEETVEFANLIHTFVTREAGQDVSPTYAGAHIKMAIVPVAKYEKLVSGQAPAHAAFIENMLAKGIDHFYVLSTGQLIKPAMNLVEYCRSRLNLGVLHEEEYTGQYKGRTAKIFCALLAKQG